LLPLLNKMVLNGDRLPAIERAVTAQLQSCGGPERCMPIEVTRNLLRALPRERLPDIVPIPKVPTVFGEFSSFEIDRWATVVRDTCYFLSRDLTRSVYIFAPFHLWDTHTENARNQKACVDVFGAGFKSLIQQLEATLSPSGRPLIEETGIVVSSELGRHPQINRYRGKGHFPENPILMLGPGLKRQTFGQTNRRMEATPFSYSTGALGGSRVPDLTDVGATIFHWMGIGDPLSYGYTGHPLECLFS
jgi:hypothetical protein